MTRGGLAIAAALVSALPPLAAAQPAVEAPRAIAVPAEVTDPSALSRQPEKRAGAMLRDLPEVAALTAAKRSMAVKLEIALTAKGSVAEVRVLEPAGANPVAAAVRATVSAWSFSPAQYQGQPVAVRLPTTMWVGYQSKKLAGQTPALPEAAKATGEHGLVTVMGRLQPDGSVGDLRVVESSKSATVDAAALAGAQAFRFEPSLDYDGSFLPREVELEFDMSQAAGESGSMMIGLTKYGCDAAVREFDWWRSVNPDAGSSDYRVRQVLGGMTILLGLEKPGQAMASLEKFRALQAKWDGTIALCRAKPGIQFLEALKKAK